MGAGRPSKYKKQYCEEIIRFFDVPRTTSKKVTHVTKAGVTTFDKTIPQELPTLIAFAHKIGVTRTTLYQWAEDHPEFSYSLKKAVELSEDFLTKNGLEGFYQPNIFQLVATNYTSMKNKETKEHTGADGGPVETKITVEFIQSDKGKTE